MLRLSKNMAPLFKPALFLDEPAQNVRGPIVGSLSRGIYLKGTADEFTVGRSQLESYYYLTVEDCMRSIHTLVTCIRYSAALFVSEMIDLNLLKIRFR